MNTVCCITFNKPQSLPRVTKSGLHAFIGHVLPGGSYINWYSGPDAAWWRREGWMGSEVLASVTGETDPDAAGWVCVETEPC